MNLGTHLELVAAEMPKPGQLATRVLGVVVHSEALVRLDQLSRHGELGVRLVERPVRGAEDEDLEVDERVLGVGLVHLRLHCSQSCSWVLHMHFIKQRNCNSEWFKLLKPS